MKYAVLDLEMCMAPKVFRKNGYKYRQETIQIGAVLFTKLETDPDYRLNELYETARKEDVDHLSFCMGDLFAGLALA